MLARLEKPATEIVSAGASAAREYRRVGLLQTRASNVTCRHEKQRQNQVHKKKKKKKDQMHVSAN
eukprot:m.134918 g.134918  ORF g.134918 m.134918 type:complete len:65 (+) comp15831_c1_seq1:897-1091(+)